MKTFEIDWEHIEEGRTVIEAESAEEAERIFEDKKPFELEDDITGERMEFDIYAI